MTLNLSPGHLVNGADIEIAIEAVATQQTVSGTPATGFVELGVFAGVDIGVWEHSVGVSTDVETDEIFVVLSGQATIEFLDSSAATITVGPGAIVRFRSGMQTRWNVSKTLRKVYLLPDAER